MAKACSLVALLSLSIFTDHTNVAFLASAQEVNDCDNIDLPLKLSLLGSDVLLKTMDIDFEDTFNLVVGGSIDDAGTLKPFLGFYDSNNSYAPIFERTIAYDGETEIVFVNFSEDRSYSCQSDVAFLFLSESGLSSFVGRLSLVRYHCSISDLYHHSSGKIRSRRNLSWH